MSSSTEISPLPPGLRLFNDNGGMSLIYHHPTDPELLVKVFTDSGHNRLPRVGDAATHIESLTSFREGLSRSQALRLQETFSWPVEIYGSRQGHIDGIAIRLAPDEFWVELGLRDFRSNSVRTVKKFQDVSYLMSGYLDSPAVVRKPYPEITFGDRIEICRELLLTMKIVWDLGYRYCDYKPHNLAWTLEPRPRVFVIDAESVERPGVRGPHSPGEWWPLLELIDRMESDRSLCARVMWRILAKDMGALPPHGSADGYTSRLDRKTVGLFESAHAEGTAAVLDELLDDLGRYRSEENVQLAFDWAASTNFGTIVLAYAPESSSAGQRDVIDNARVQVAMEEEIRSLQPLLRMLRMSRTVPAPGFVWDIAEDPSEAANVASRDALRALALQGRHEELATAILGSGLPEETSRLFRRSAQVALAQVGRPRLSVRSEAGGSIRLEWSWPGGELVRGASIVVSSVIGRDVIFEGFADKNRNRPSMRLPDRSCGHDTVSCKVSFAVVTSDGTTITCPIAADLTVGLPEAPTTTRPSASIADLPRTFVRPTPTPGNSPTLSPGWYPDPEGRSEQRFFDGVTYTSLVRDRGREYDEGRGADRIVRRLDSITRRLSNGIFRRR